MTDARVWKANGCRYELAGGYQSVTLPMPSTGKARPRVTVRGTFMPAEYQHARAALRMLFGTVHVHPPCRMALTVIRKMPASWSRKMRAARLGTYCPVKPDNDNIEGWVMDTLFKDDKLSKAAGRSEDDAGVVHTGCIKVWGPRHALRVELWAVDPDEKVIDVDAILAELE